MKKQNLFDGSDALQNTVLKALGFTETVNEISIYGATRPFLSSTYHYLHLRFGEPTLKKTCNVCAWNFQVKEFTIQINISSHLQFIVFGNIYKAGGGRSPAFIHEKRLRKPVEHLLYNLFGEMDIEVKKNVMDMFFKKHNVETLEEFNELDESVKQKFNDYAKGYNSALTGSFDGDWEYYKKKYGNEYSNSYTRFALRTLTSFIHNLLTPIYLDGDAMNIKGIDNDFDVYNKYRDNIDLKKIEYNL